jgi:Glycosyl transferase family 2
MSSPRLSILLIARGPYEELREVVASLRGQGPVDGLELVIVAPSRAELALPEGELDDFAGVRVVEHGRVDSLGRPLAAGLRAATAPVVAVTEDHAFPEPGWADALLEAHEGPYAAVGPAILNANPDSAISWGNLLLSYGPWVAPVKPGSVDDLPEVNASYKRSAVLELGDLEELLEKGGQVFTELQKRGHGLYLEPRALVRHANYARLAPTAHYRVNAARLYADVRVREEGWSAARRAAYLVAAPLIPVVRFARLTRSLRARGHPLEAKILGGLALALALDMAGQILAFAAGRGRALDVLHELEFEGERRPVR